MADRIRPHFRQRTCTPQKIGRDKKVQGVSQKTGVLQGGLSAFNFIGCVYGAWMDWYTDWCLEFLSGALGVAEGVAKSQPVHAAPGIKCILQSFPNNRTAHRDSPASPSFERTQLDNGISNHNNTICFS